LFKKKDYKQIAEMMGQIVHNTDLRNAIIKGQQERLNRFKSMNLEAKLKEHLQPLL
jgi:hypothetical protein